MWTIEITSATDGDRISTCYYDPSKTLTQQTARVGRKKINYKLKYFDSSVR